MFAANESTEVLPMNRSALSLAALAALAAVALALPASDAHAQSYRCVGKDGKKYYGQTIPRACIGQPVEQLNAQGLVIRRIEPQLSAEERAAKDAEAQKKREEAAAAKEEQRRVRALLATYTSLKDLEDARTRALAENDKAIIEVDQRIDTIKARQKKQEKELEFYKGKNKAPAKLAQEIKDAQVDLEAQQGLRDVKKKEVAAINAKYDEDKARYIELTKPKK